MNPIAPQFVVIGSGLAGYTVIRELRKLDAATPVTLISADAGDFYAKPSLSNALAQGKSAAQLITTPAEAIATQLGVTLMSHTRVNEIRAQTQTVVTTRGEVRYSRLVLALGADPVRLPLQGDAVGAVLSVNDLGDYAVFREQLGRAQHVAILGAGLIGCEFANDLATAGHRVTVVDPSDRPLARLLPAPAGQAVQQALQKAGVYWVFGRRAQAVSHRARSGVELTLDDGSSIEADLVLSAVGLRPRTALAQAAGLVVGRGIVVDRRLETSMSGIYAIGDCAEIDGQVLPYVQPIMHAAKALAKTLSGDATVVSFPPMPVVVKTPACPVATQPAPPEAVGNWLTEEGEDGLRMVFSTADHAVAGFALTGGRTAERANLVKQLAA